MTIKPVNKNGNIRRFLVKNVFEVNVKTNKEIQCKDFYINDNYVS